MEVEDGRVLQINDERSREQEEKNNKWHRGGSCRSWSCEGREKPWLSLGWGQRRGEKREGWEGGLGGWVNIFFYFV